MELSDPQVQVALIAAVPTIIGSILVYVASLKAEKREDPTDPSNQDVAGFLLNEITELTNKLEEIETENKRLKSLVDLDSVTDSDNAMPS